MESPIQSHDKGNVDGRYYEAVPPGSFGERLLILARDRIYADFIRLMNPSSSETILDIGVSDVVGEGANVIERLYPLKGQITAAGLGEGNDFRIAFPAIRYVRIEAGAPLPFEDGAFDIACANAVLEHVGSKQRQREFILELQRVAARVYITVPNRFFPIEHHTAIPVLHFNNASFRIACKLTKKTAWMLPENLILMSRRSLASLCPPNIHRVLGETGLPLGPFSSNLFLALGAKVASREHRIGRRL